MRIGRKGHPPGNELLHPHRPLLHNSSDNIFLAEARAGLERILNMPFKRIFRRHHGCNAALGMERGAFQELPLGDERHRPKLGELDR